jgi:hypothetical protein
VVVVTTWTDQDSRDLTVALVAVDGHRMPLRGDERAEALRLMAGLGLDRQTIATRLCLTVPAVTRAARYYGVTLPSMVEPQHWTVAVYDRSKAPGRWARRKRRQTEGVAA